ncbi:hypothetical protein L7F22_061979 [Adiantum nelumboides]|nr:hypothetical protein [Adiantum nelumboides]
MIPLAHPDDSSLSRETAAAAHEPDHPLLPFLKKPHAESNEDELGANEASGKMCPAHCSIEGSGQVDWDIALSTANSDRATQADSPSLQFLASNPHHSENNATYFIWPASYNLQGSAGSRTAFFYNSQKDVDVDVDVSERAPSGPQAATLSDVMIIRAFHCKRLRHVSLRTAVGFRTRQGCLTNIPAIIVFVARKVHKAWLQEGQRLPIYLEGPGGVWCDVDVVEFLYYGAPAVTPKEQVYTELVEGLRGNDPCIGPGSQVASHETYGTLGAIVQSRTGAQQVGFLTNRQVAVDLDYPNQKMFHPLPPNVGPGVFLGAVERATSFITDDRWYNIFASRNPETFVRADGAFIPFGDSFDMSRVTTTVRGVGGMGEVASIGLQAPISSIVGRQVVKVGRSSGLTKGRIMAYALEYNDEKGICFFTDFLIVGEDKQAFDLEGDSGSLILMVEEGMQKPRPVGIIWGGTANRGRLKLQSGHAPENWTSGVDLGRLLECLQLDLITSDAALGEAIEKQRRLACGELSEWDCYSHHAGKRDDNQPLASAQSLIHVQADKTVCGYHENANNVPGSVDAHVMSSNSALDNFIRKHDQHNDKFLTSQEAASKSLFFDLNVSSNEAEFW